MDNVDEKNKAAIKVCIKPTCPFKHLISYPILTTWFSFPQATEEKSKTKYEGKMKILGEKMKKIYDSKLEEYKKSSDSVISEKKAALETFEKRFEESQSKVSVTRFISC